MPFDHCKQCKKCCHVEAGFPPLEISLLADEKRCWQSLEISTACRFLGEQGCTLGDQKPFACHQYPVSFDPKGRRFYFDSDCPLYDQYQRDLQVESSVAHQHLQGVIQAINLVSEQEPAFLQKNFELDADYFDLLSLKTPAKLKKLLKTKANAR